MRGEDSRGGRRGRSATCPLRFRPSHLFRIDDRQREIEHGGDLVVAAGVVGVERRVGGRRLGQPLVLVQVAVAGAEEAGEGRVFEERGAGDAGGRAAAPPPARRGASSPPPTGSVSLTSMTNSPPP